ncbi:MAG: hypothetical protein ACE5GK_03675 [Nitrospiria bacterium]
MLSNRFYIIASMLFFLARPSASIAVEGVVSDIEAYFPDEIGMTWTYQGTVTDDVIRIAAYRNIAAVKGWTVKDGIKVKVFTETNQINQGPAESYFSKEHDGIVYYGGEPTTDFEGHLVPYRVIQFPVVLHKSFSQLSKKGIPFERDFDQDGIDEVADVMAEVTAEGFEGVSVPAGFFKDALKLKGIMVIRVTLSNSGDVIDLVDRTTTWHGLGVGTVKAVVSFEYPGIGGLPPTTTLFKELLSEYSFGVPSSH